MKYKIDIWPLVREPREIELDYSEFQALRQARSCLSNALAIEEKYELLLSNYLDLEKECLSLTVDFMVGKSSKVEYRTFFDISLLLNRKIVNFLTSVRLYIDQLQYNFRACMPNEEDRLHSKFSLEYDSFFEYRFMEALRNYVQHKGLAIHNTKIDRMSKNKKVEYVIRVFTYKAELKSDEKFKKVILEEMPDKVDLIQAIRIYIESINKIHLQIRNLISSNVNSSRRLIEDYIERCHDSGNSGGDILHAISYEPRELTNEIIESFPLLLEWDDIRISLIEKNGELTNLDKKVSVPVLNEEIGI